MSELLEDAVVLGRVATGMDEIRANLAGAASFDELPAVLEV